MVDVSLECAGTNNPGEDVCEDREKGEGGWLIEGFDLLRASSRLDLALQLGTVLHCRRHFQAKISRNVSCFNAAKTIGL